VIRVLLVDDHALFREGLASLLGGQPDFTVVGEAGSVKEAIAFARNLQPDLVLMDFSLPDGTGLDATQAILRACPGTRIVFLTVHEEDHRLFAAIRSGAKGYMLKNVPVAKLLERLRGLERDEAAISPTLTGRILDAFARTTPARRPNNAEISQLTPRELDVLAELATGASNKDIAARLFITENTVKNHVGSVLSKLGLPNRRVAARFAQQQSIIKTPSRFA